MTIFSQTSEVESFVERADSSAVRSHQSYVAPVEAVCHHSGRYLTRTEVNPQQVRLLREQHDFPGFPALDDLFRSAAHATEHQHLIWSQPGLKGTAFVLTGALMLGAAALALLRRQQYASGG